MGHIFLSGDNEDIIVGNFIADSVKGKKYKLYPTEIQKGILLHRKIDEFTDKNEHFQNIKLFFIPVYNHYSGVVADLTVDYYLALNWSNYSDIPLKIFTSKIYNIFLKNYHIIPVRMKRFLHNLIYRDRLLTYSSLKGIKEALSIMSFHSELPDFSAKAVRIIDDNNKEMNNLFNSFINEIREYVQIQKDEILIDEEKDLNANATAQICFDQGSIKRKEV
ncbi:MAG: acyl carrier protein phosphodiesterase [Prolixibacteraceae bacterium]|nr:acyl carrier protein phosphodiesterase [Prolixibacteraceae bacterium]